MKGPLYASVLAGDRQNAFLFERIPSNIFVFVRFVLLVVRGQQNIFVFFRGHQIKRGFVGNPQNILRSSSF